MFSFLIVLIGLLAIILILIILLQSGKGGGLAGIASGGTTQILGARQAPDVLEKATWTLGTLFIVLCILTNFAIDTEERRQSVIEGQIQQQDQPAPNVPLTPPLQQPTEPSPAPPADGN
jgi:preprotein translocase subunit SecG